MKIKWKCGYCEDAVVSDSKKHHQMDSCACGRSAMDLEAFYRREIGSVIVLEQLFDPDSGGHGSEK